MVLCHLCERYCLPLLSTMVQGVSVSFEVNVSVVPGGIGAAACGTVFVSRYAVASFLHSK
jgi:hypothetical protein